ncbi:MAG: hypothetical protein KME10_26575 [Plectolyngbya sp. WJT66-NPBG17]|nr:hypothetical protein [Plectolyngbya sp. WJT66-NPBG17]
MTAIDTKPYRHKQARQTTINVVFSLYLSLQLESRLSKQLLADGASSVSISLRSDRGL